MNLITETNRRLEYHENKIKDLQKCCEKTISDDGMEYIKDEISKSKKNIKYYSLILEKLEELK